MADGYGFGAEGDWKAAALVRILKVMGDGLPGGTSFMEDYTYHLGEPVPEVLGAHMLEVCPSIARAAVVRDPSAIDRREERPGPAGLRRRPGPAVVVGFADLGDRFRLIANEVDIVEPDAPLPKLPVARAVWRPRPDLATAAEAWLTAGGPHHTALTTAVGLDVIHDFAEMADGARRHRRGHDRPRVRERAPLEPGVLLPEPRDVGGRLRHPRRRRPTDRDATGPPPAARPRRRRDHRRLLGRAPAANRERTIPHGFAQLDRAGNFHDLRLAAGASGRYEALGLMFGTPFPFLDSDVYKWLEAAGWELGRADSDELRSQADAAIDLVAKAQRPDGYLNTFVQVLAPGTEYPDLKWGHELYCLGHLIQAAVAWKRALDDDRLLEVASRAAAHARRPSARARARRSTVIPRSRWPSSSCTGRPASGGTWRRRRAFLDRRGHGLLGSDRFGAAYWQDHATVRDAPTVAGHAVRQLYLDCGAVDVATELGDAGAARRGPAGAGTTWSRPGRT